MNEFETPKTTPIRPQMSGEIMAMAMVDQILADLPPASARRVVAWVQSVTEERVEEEFGLRFDIPEEPGF